MIDLSKGPVHISSGPSTNPNSLCMTIISMTLGKNGKVIWMTRKLPHSEKLSDILGHHTEKEMNRMMIIEFEDNISGKAEQIKKIIPSLEPEDLLIVEEWCESYGRAKNKDSKLMKEFVKLNNNMNCVITSNSYEDASGQKRGFEGWMARGEKSLGDAYRTVWLTKIQEQFQKVMITDGDKQKIVNLTKKGFED
ncbi:MAG: hypothetical protein ISR09_05630 [Candidatus Thalassarchaeum sp.]|nr:hypothetical protein [Candidatus Thalassarchaeum sp.]